MAVKWLALRGPFTAGSWQALNGRQMATLKRAICDKKWLAMLPFLPFVALTETTNGPFMSCLLGCFLSEIAIPINRHVINVGFSFGYSSDCGSIQFLLPSFESDPGTCIATETSDTPGQVSLSTAADSRSHYLKSRRCEIVSLENFTRVSGCQGGSMLSRSIAAETHVKVRAIK